MLPVLKKNANHIHHLSLVRFSRKQRRKLGFSAAKTMMIAQQLYEGLELGDLGSFGLITYMRTDSTRIAEEALKDARTVIGSLFSERHLPKAVRVYGKIKMHRMPMKRSGHRRLMSISHLTRVKDYLSKDQYRLYDLVWKRFLASQMENAISDSTRVDIDGDGCIFRATGSIIKFDGFLALYDESTDDVAENGDKENERLAGCSAKSIRFL